MRWDETHCMQRDPVQCVLLHCLDQMEIRPGVTSSLICLGYFNLFFSQRAGGQGYFKVVLTIIRGCFQRIPGHVWACKACEHQVCYPESIVICFLLCHVCQGEVGDICERLSRMSNVKEIKDSLCVRKFTWLWHNTVCSTLLLESVQYLIGIAGLSLHLFYSGYISHQTPEKSLDWITMFVIVVVEAGMRSSSSLKSKVHVQLHFSVGFMVIFC